MGSNYVSSLFSPFLIAANSLKGEFASIERAEYRNNLKYWDR